MSAREKVLLRGLVDWVALDRVHWDVTQENPGLPLPLVQEETLGLLRSLLADGLFQLGDLTGAASSFSPWNSSIDQSLDRVRSVYVSNFEDRNVWPWYCWIDLTVLGESVALTIERAGHSPAS